MLCPPPTPTVCIIGTTMEAEKRFYFDLYENVFSALPLGISVINTNQEIVYANEMFHSLLLSREEKPERKYLQNLLPDRELENHIGYVQINGGVKEVELYLKLAGGDRKALKAIVIGITIGNMANPAALLVLEDISERIKLEEQFVQSEKLAGMGELAASIVHELGNPLSVMNSTLQYIQERLKGREDDINNEIDIIVDNIKRMDELLRELCNLRTPELHRFEQGNIHKALSQVLALVSCEARNGNIKIKADLAQDLPICWHDPRLIKQVFLNLFKNAIRAMPLGGCLTIRTWFSSAEDPGARSKITIEISDTGVGISEEELRFIFKPFYSTKKRGSGLGLPFCRRVVDAHRGTICVESVKGKGSTFTIYLPLGRRKGDE